MLVSLIGLRMDGVATREQDAWVASTFGVDPAAAGVGDAGAKGADTAGGDIAAQSAKLAKLATVWQAAEKRVHKDVDGLLKHLKDLYGDDPSSVQMEKDFQVHFDKVTSTFDGTLAKELSAATAAGTAADLAKAKAELKATIEDFAKTVAADETVVLMDENPFVPLDIAGLCRSTLGVMLGQLT